MFFFRSEQFVSGFRPARGVKLWFCKKLQEDKEVIISLLWFLLTPHQQVSRRLVDAPGVTGHAGVSAGVGQVGGANQQAAGLQQGEPGQLDGAAGQDAFACTQGRW